MLRWFNVTPCYNSVCKKKYSLKNGLKCLDKLFIIWSHKWCQNVNSFLLNEWQITESTGPPTHIHPEKTFHISKHKDRPGNPWRDLDTLCGYQLPPYPPHRHIFSLRGYGEWWRVSVLTLSKWQPLEVLLCFWDQSVHVLLSVDFPPMFPFVVFFGLLL